MCNHRNSTAHRLEPSVILYPNFVLQNGSHIYSHESLHHGDFVYVGGDVAVERKMVEKFSAEVIHHGASIHCWVKSLNQEAMNQAHPQLNRVDAHALSGIMYRYLFIQMNLCVGRTTVCTPSNMAEYDMWAWSEFPRMLSCFTHLWMNHADIIGPCDDNCSKCIVVDGHQKARRRICAHKNVSVNTAELKHLVIGCCRTPAAGNRYCVLHMSQEETNATTSIGSTKNSCRRRNQSMRDVKRGRKLTKRNGLNATGCRTGKERAEEYRQKCARSFGLIALVYNCKVISGFAELFRSETLKEIIHLFCACIRGKYKANYY